MIAVAGFLMATFAGGERMQAPTVVLSCNTLTAFEVKI